PPSAGSSPPGVRGCGRVLRARVVPGRPLAADRAQGRRPVGVRRRRGPPQRRLEHHRGVSKHPLPDAGGLVLRRVMRAAPFVLVRGGSLIVSGGAGSSARSGHVHWHASRSIGLPWHGRLVHGVRLPASGRTFFTWDPALRREPDRPWRRWGNERLIKILFSV